MPATPSVVSPLLAARRTARRPGSLVRGGGLGLFAALGFLLSAVALDAQSMSVGLSSVRAQRFGRAELPNANPGGEDRFGAAFAIGDFDGDGADDLATGASFNNGPAAAPVERCGQVVVRYGSAGAGLDEAGPLVVLGQFVSGSLNPAEAGDEFGFALAACDLNGDGIDDLAVGVPFEDFPLGLNLTIFDAGLIEIYYGASGGLAPPASAVFRGLFNTSLQAGFSRFGYTLACGDFDDNGFDDLVVGQPGRDVNDVNDAGRIQIFPGSAAGIGVGVYVIDQDSVGMGEEAGAADYFGDGLGVGDFDGDDFDDLAIAVPGEVHAGPIRGAVQMLYGSPEGLGTDRDQTFINPQQGGDSNFGAFGHALAAGSFDGDPYDELAIGDFGGDDDEQNSGSVYVLGGSAAGLSLTGFLRLSPDTILGEGASAPLELFGSALAAGDFDADGADDLAAGSPNEDVLGVSNGAVTILMGSIGGGFQPGTSRARQINHGLEGIPGTASEDQVSFGSALSAGDFDGDGHSDLVVGAPFEGESLLPRVGTATVLYGALFADGFDGGFPDYWSGVVP